MEMLLRSKFPRNDYDEKYDMIKYKVANEYSFIAVLDMRSDSLTIWR